MVVKSWQLQLQLQLIEVTLYRSKQPFCFYSVAASQKRTAIATASQKEKAYTVAR